jgi:hypothetical protein
MLLDMVCSPFLHRCNKTCIYTNHTRTTCIQASKFTLGLKLEEGCSDHLLTVSAPHCQFSHYKILLLC